MDFDRIKGPLARFVLNVMAKVDFHPVFSAKVVQQLADGSLDLLPDSTLVPAPCGVPIRTLAPGVTLKVAPGSRCGFFYEDGDIKRPVVGLFEPSLGSTLELSLSATTKIAADAPLVSLGDAAAAVGRVGDAVTPAALWTAWFTAVGTAIGTPPPALPFATIASGSPKVKA